MEMMNQYNDNNAQQSKSDTIKMMRSPEPNYHMAKESIKYTNTHKI